MKDLVIVYYDFDVSTYEINYTKLVNLLDDSIILIKNEQDFNKYKDRILYRDTRIRVGSYNDFISAVSVNYKALTEIYDEFDIHDEFDIFVDIAKYKNAVKLLELKSDKVYAYSLDSFILSFYRGKSITYEDASCGNKLHISLNKTTANISEELNIYIDNLSFPYLTIYSCGTGTLLFEKARCLENQGLVIFPKELKYLFYADCTNFNFKAKVKVDTMVFLKNTRYIDLHKLCLCFKFKTLVVSRGTCLRNNPGISFNTEFTD